MSDIKAGRAQGCTALAGRIHPFGALGFQLKMLAHFAAKGGGTVDIPGGGKPACVYGQRFLHRRPATIILKVEINRHLVALSIGNQVSNIFAPGDNAKRFCCGKGSGGGGAGEERGGDEE